MRGRGKTTGRFKTRQQLVDAIWMDYRKGRKTSHIARDYKISEATAHNIIDKEKPSQ